MSSSTTEPGVQVPGDLPPRMLRRLYELQRRRELGDPLEWLGQYLPDVFSLAFGPHHRFLADLLHADGASGLRAVVGAPRGAGKSAFATLALPLIALHRRSHAFVVIVRARADDATRSVEALANLCTLVAEQAPWMLPRRQTGGELLLTSGAYVVARGAGAAIRGLQRQAGTRVRRPDLFIGDDLETDESARSPLRVTRMESWVHGTVAQLGGPPGGRNTTPLDILLVGTTLTPSSMLTRALEGADEWGAWERGRFPAEAVYVDGQALDTQKRAVPVPVPPDTPPHGRVALWPAGLPLTHLDRLTDPAASTYIGTLLYAQEYLLDPRSSTDVLFPQGFTRYDRPTGTLVRSATGVDSAASQKDSADYSAVVTVSLYKREPDGVPVLYVHPSANRRRVQEPALIAWAEAEATSAKATVAFEAQGGFLWGAQALQRNRRVPVRAVSAKHDKRTRATPLTLWHEAGRLLVDPALRGSAFDSEMHAFTGAGDLHDDLVDALVHACALLTNGWHLF